MKSKWLWALGMGCWVLFGVIGGRSKEPPPFLPPEVVLLSHQAVVLRQVEVLEAPDLRSSLILLGIADLNGDGFPDLAVGVDGKVQVWVGNGSGRFNLGPSTDLEATEDPKGRTTPLNYFVVASGVLADLDGDGIPDLVVRGSKLNRRYLYLLRGLGNGEFARAAVIPCPGGAIFSFLWPTRGAIFFTVRDEDTPTRLYRVDFQRGLGNPRMEMVRKGKFHLGWAGDLEGDGVVDLILFTEERVWVLQGEGFQEGPEFVPLEGKVQGVRVADLNGDGLQDLVVRTAMGVVAGLRRGSDFTQVSAVGIPFPFWAYYLADLTGDGFPDLLVQRSDGFYEFHLFPGDGRGGFLRSVSSFVVVDGVLSRPHFADLNGDGLLDVVFAWPLGFRRIRVYLNGGTPKGVSLHPLSGGLLAVGDLSGNGAPDVLVADVGRKGVRVLWNVGCGRLISASLAGLGRLPLAAAIAQHTAFLLLPGTKWFPDEVVAVDAAGRVRGRWRVDPEVLPSFAVADLDGDGVEDVALPAKGKLLVLWGGKDLRTYAWPKGEVSFLGGRGGKLWAVSIGEYADLMEIAFVRRKPRISPPLLSLEAMPLAMTVGDLDGDGVPDPVVLAVKLGTKLEDGEGVVFPERVVAGMVLSSTGPLVEEVPGFPTGRNPWPFLGVAVGRIGGVPHLACTTSAGDGVFLVSWEGAFQGATRVDVPGGPVLAADLDGNGDDEFITSTLGLGTLLVILWNGGGR